MLKDSNGNILRSEPYVQSIDTSVRLDKSSLEALRSVRACLRLAASRPSEYKKYVKEAWDILGEELR